MDEVQTILNGGRHDLLVCFLKHRTMAGIGQLANFEKEANAVAVSTEGRFKRATFSNPAAKAQADAAEARFAEIVAAEIDRVRKLGCVEFAAA